MLSGARGKSIEEEDDVFKELALLKAKLNSAKLTKSPQLAFDTIEYFRFAILSKLDKAIGEIDELFADSRVFVYVNGDIYKPLLDVSFLNAHTKLFKDKSLNIFEKDLYKDEIKEITWTTEKWGLKGAKKHNTLAIHIQLVLGDLDPILKININTQPNIIEYPFDYEEPIDDKVLQHFKRELLKGIMREIKLSI